MKSTDRFDSMPGSASLLETIMLMIWRLISVNDIQQQD